MANIRLFKTIEGVVEIPATSALLEREIQTFIEKNMKVLFGVTFMRSEFSTSNGGWIDSLGVDENRCPVIFEYKRSISENVINQGLFYLDWLMDHKADFELLVLKSPQAESASKLDWSMPRLICIANDFTKYDEHAVKQINRNIDLVRYRRFGPDLLMFEVVNSNIAAPEVSQLASTPKAGAAKTASSCKTIDEYIATMEKHTRELMVALQDHIRALGPEIEERKLAWHFAYRKTFNIICVTCSRSKVYVYLKLNPSAFDLEPGFTRDVTNIGHWGTGDLEITMKTDTDFEKAKPLIQQAYERG